jgi:hypothetical protein
MAFLWAHKALNSPFRRFWARVVLKKRSRQKGPEIIADLVIQQYVETATALTVKTAIEELVRTQGTRPRCDCGHNARERQG